MIKIKTKTESKNKTVKLATLPKYRQAEELQRVLQREVPTFVLGGPNGWEIHSEKPTSEVQKLRIQRIVNNYLKLEVQAA